MIMAREGGHNVRLKIFNVFNEEYRNSVVHNAEKIDEEAMKEILQYSEHLFQFLTKTTSYARCSFAKASKNPVISIFIASAFSNHNPNSNTPL